MEKFEAKIQVDKNHYAFGHEVSFLNAYNQVADVLFLIKRDKIVNPKILIVGVGDGLLGIILQHKFGYFVKTIDIDGDLKPNYVGSVSELDSIIHEKFDIVVCAHVLEHLPYKYFYPSLRNIKSISSYAIVYLPIAQFGLSLDFGLFPIFSKKIKLFSTWFFKRHSFDGQHYWEIGTKGHALSSVRKTIEKYFMIERKYNAKNWLYSYNFILKSKS